MKRLLLTGMALAAMSTVFSVSAAVFPTAKFSPASGTAVKSIEKVTITVPPIMPDWDSSALIAEASVITIQKEGGTVVNALSVTPGEGDESGMPYEIVFPEQTEEGEYTLTIPAGTFCREAYDWDTQTASKDLTCTNELITASYTVSADAKNPSPFDSYLVQSPDPYADTFRKIESVDIYFTGLLYYANIETDETKEITLSNGTITYKVNEGGYGTSKSYTPVDENGNDVVIKEEGVWTFIIPEGYYTYNGSPNNEIKLSWTVEAFNGDITYNVYPANGSTRDMSTGANLTVNFDFSDCAEEVDYKTKAEGYANAAITVKYCGKELDAVNYMVSERGYQIQNNDGAPNFKIDISSRVFTRAGELEITIDKGYFMVEGFPSPAISYKVNVVNPEYTYNAIPESGSKVDLPEENLVVTFSLPDGYTAATEPFVDPYVVVNDDAHNTGNSGEILSFRVTYNGQGIPAATNANPEDYVGGKVDEEKNYNGYVLTASGNKVMMTIDKTLLTQVGELKIVADRGAYTIDGHPGPAIAYTLQVGEKKDVKYTLINEAGTQFDKFGKFILTFPEAQTVKFNTGSSITIGSSNGLTLTQYNCEKVADAAVPTYEITFDPEPWKAGQYFIGIEAGAFLIDGTQPSPAIQGGPYTLNRTTDIDMTVLPSPEGSKTVAYDYGTYVSFVFPEEEDIDANRDVTDPIIVKFDDTELVLNTDYKLEASVAQGAAGGLNININIWGPDDYNNLPGSPYCGRTGTLYVKIPAGKYLISGQPMAEIEKTWQVVAPKTQLSDFKFNITPECHDDWDAAPVVGSLKTVEIAFPEAESASWIKNAVREENGNRYSMVTLALDNPFGGSYPMTMPTIEMVDNTEVPTIRLTFDPAPTENSLYALRADYGAFFIDDAHEMPGFTKYFNLSVGTGIEGIEADTESAKIYSLQGIYLGTDFESLPAGIYIRGGKKVIKK